jgi:HAD superfamily hydrolase (TIGR01509 family)
VFKAVIFDCDGVLVDSEPLANELLAQTLTNLGWPMDQAECTERFIGLSMPGVDILVRERLGSAVPDDWLEPYRKAYHARLADEIMAIPGVEAVVAHVVELGLATAVASSGGHRGMAVKLGRTGLIRYFEGRVASSEDVGIGKPDPAVYHYAAAMIGVDPRHCIAIEDSPNGVRAGVAAGMLVLGYAATTEKQRLLDAGAAVTFENMAEVPALLARYLDQPRAPIST